MSDRQAEPRARSHEHRSLGEAVRALRERHGLTQAQLAAGAGLRRHHLAAIERGEVDPTFLTLVRITRAVPVPLVELMLLFDERRARP
jgi:transcriptional regulator with XRE-family HTH domain